MDAPLFPDRCPECDQFVLWLVDPLSMWMHHGDVRCSLCLAMKALGVRSEWPESARKALSPSSY